MLTMNDIRTYQRGQKAKAEDLANNKINQLIGQEESQANAMEQQVNQQTERSLEEDANTVLQELHKAKDPQAEFEQLPPILQKKVMELMNGGNQQQTEQQPQTEQSNDGYTRQPMGDGDGDNDSLPDTQPESPEQYSR